MFVDKKKSNIGKNIILAIYSLVIGGYPIVASFGLQYNLENRQVTIPYRLIILFFAMVLFVKRRRKNTKIEGKFLIPFFVFWGIYLLKIFFLEILPEPSEISASEFFLYAFGTCFIPMVAFFEYIPSFYEKPLRISVFGVLFLGSLVSLYFGVVNHFVLMQKGFVNQRISTDVLDPISLGNIGASLIIVAVCSFYRTDTGCFSKIVCAFCTLLGGSIILGSGSRGPVVSIFVFLCLFFLFYMRKYFFYFVIMTCVFWVFSKHVIVYMSDEMELQSASRLEHGLEYEADQSISERFRILDWSIKEFLENPLIGGKLEGQGKGRYPHNVVVESFMATGIVGGVGFCLIFLISIWKSYVMLKNRKQLNWIAFLYLQYAISAQFSGSLYTNYIMWCLMAAVISNSVVNNLKKVYCENSLCC